MNELIFMGTGTSGGVPVVTCITAPEFNTEDGCATCSDAHQNPLTSKNVRNNTSILLKCRDAKNILVDCGKTFYAQAKRWCPQYSIRTLDAVLLTHPHADAMLGLDDLR